LITDGETDESIISSRFATLITNQILYDSDSKKSFDNGSKSNDSGGSIYRWKRTEEG